MKLPAASYGVSKGFKNPFYIGMRNVVSPSKPTPSSILPRIKMPGILYD
jgi:hypothetical protein